MLEPNCISSNVLNQMQLLHYLCFYIHLMHNSSNMVQQHYSYTNDIFNVLIYEMNLDAAGCCEFENVTAFPQFGYSALATESPVSSESYNVLYVTDIILPYNMNNV